MKAGTICGTDAEPLRARSQRDLQSIVKQKNLVLRKERTGALAVRGVVNRAEGWNGRLEDGFTLVLEANRGQIVPAETEVKARVESIGLALVVTGELKISDWIESGKFWIDGRTVVVTALVSHVLIGNRVSNLVVDLM